VIEDMPLLCHAYDTFDWRLIALENALAALAEDDHA
jgi:hypothetical protein